MDQNDILKIVQETANYFAREIKVDDPVCKIIDTGVVERDGQNREITNVGIVFDGSEMGFMIGPRGRHLASLQSIMNMILNKKLEAKAYVNVLVDVCGYNAKKIEKIESMVLKKADDARILGTYIDLEPMTSYERRIVHSVLSKFDDITTESFGEGRDRFVRISVVSDTELGIGNGNNVLEESEDTQE